MPAVGTNTACLRSAGGELLVPLDILKWTSGIVRWSHADNSNRAINPAPSTEDTLLLTTQRPTASAAFAVPLVPAMSGARHGINRHGMPCPVEAETRPACMMEFNCGQHRC